MEDNKRGGFGRRNEGRREYGQGSSERRQSGERVRRPRISSGDRPRRTFSDNGERRQYGENPERKVYSSSEHRGYGERRSFGNGGERRSFGGGEHRSYNGNGERRSYGNNGERRSYGNNGGEERRSYGERRSFGGDRRQSGDRKPFSNGERRSFNNGERKSFGGERKQFGGRSTGFRNTGRKSFYKKDFSYFRNEEESGIDRMISRRPQVDGNTWSDNDMVQTPIKEEVRLNKFIANSGICSRREADNFILAGVVTVNGEVVTELGTKININTDDVRFNGERLKGEEKVYIIMNKPKGYVTTASDPHADKTVMDLLKGCTSRVFPVGRLDKNTTGVLMFTNDGEIAEKLTHPSYDKKKIYQVSLDSKLKQEDYEKILAGVELSDGTIAADALEYIEEDDHRKLGIEIHSGKNRIVRRIFESLGYEVKALDRVYFAGLTKKGIKRGSWRYLTEGEANLLKMGAYL